MVAPKESGWLIHEALPHLINRPGATRLPPLAVETRSFPSPPRNGFGFVPDRLERLYLLPDVGNYM
jgi:hypothetical protein